MTLACHSNVIMYMPCEWINVKKSLNPMQKDLEKRFPELAILMHSN